MNVDTLNKEEVKEFVPDDEVLTVARTIWGEARGEKPEGQVAIGCVIMNRFKAKKWYSGETIAKTCLKPYQFSCWNEDDPNRKLLSRLTKEQLGNIYLIANNCVCGLQQDLTKGATHYCTKAVVDKTSWAKGKKPCCEIGNHLFFKNID